MWILPSRGRPHNLARLINACRDTGADTPVCLRLDWDDPMLPAYCQIALPDAWTHEIGPRVALSAVYNEAFQRAPRTHWWGFIADDVVPETPEWDRRLIEAAGSDGMAVPAGGHDPEGAPHFVLGGALVREIGWLSLPGLDRLYIDTVWVEIAEERGVLRRLPDAVLAHRHFSNRKALFDRTYRKRRKAEDKAIYRAWQQRRSP